jgi:DNA-binding MarR family transcriptional regulator
MDDESVLRLRRVIGKLARQLNPSSTNEGLTPSQASVLGLVVARGPLSLTELAELEGLNPTMLSRVISNLDARGLIRRIPDPSDLRAASVESSEQGARVDQQVKAQRAAAVSTSIEHLRPEQIAALLEALPALEALAVDLQRSTHPLKRAVTP